MAIKNEFQLKKFLMEKCQEAIARTQEKVVQDVVEQAEAFYSDYTPMPVEHGGYDRTYQLKDTDNFIQKSPISSSENQCEASVYLDVNSLNYVTGKQPTGEQVVSTAVQGLHGVSDGEGWKYVSGDTGVKLWDESLQTKATENLIQELIRQGFSK